MVLPTPSAPAPPLPETSPQEVRSYADGSPRDRRLMSGWSRRVADELDEEDRQVNKGIMEAGHGDASSSLSSSHWDCASSQSERDDVQNDGGMIGAR